MKGSHTYAETVCIKFQGIFIFTTTLVKNTLLMYFALSSFLLHTATVVFYSTIIIAISVVRFLTCIRLHDPSYHLPKLIQHRHLKQPCRILYSHTLSDSILQERAKLCQAHQINSFHQKISIQKPASQSLTECYKSMKACNNQKAHTFRAEL